MKVLLLAGGSGKRLWPLSRTTYPKQFLKFGSDASLLEKTLQRLQPLNEEIYIATSADSYTDVTRLATHVPKENIIIEPACKNTAPALAWSIQSLLERGVDENVVLAVLPSDHLIHPADEFCAYLKKAEKMAEAGSIVIFGVPPTRPETGFGYIKAAQGVVEAFVEKPDLKTAEKYLLSGGYFWNCGIFCFTLKTMKEELKKYCPEIWNGLKTYDTLPTLSIDYAVIEKTQKLKMIPMHLSWSDVGSWDNLYEVMEKDHNQNVLLGNCVALDTKNCLMLAEKRMIATIGLENVLVIETPDAVLVAKRECSQKVKELVEQLASKGSSEVVTPLTTQRPWGFYSILEEGHRYKIKRIHVNPQAKLSLQLHYHRSEHWVVVSGTAKVTINEKETLVHEGESIFVPKTASHRIENPGKVALEIIEVQVGEYLGEDDIIRLEDIYGRKNTVH